MKALSMTLDELEFYRTPCPMAGAGKRAALLDPLPRDVSSLAQIVQGLMLHEHLAKSAYGVDLTPEQHVQVHIRDVASILDHIIQHDARPLSDAREPGKRIIGVCRHFSLLMVAMLRAKGYAARSRCGFGTYFEAEKFVDHWVAEYWHEADQRWVMVDAQIDDVLVEKFQPDFDTLDVPHDRFVVAGDAWMMVREGLVDADRFGIMDMWGHWFIAGNLIRDVAALNKVEMLPWDMWGAMPPFGEAMPAETFPLFDRLAAATRAPDTTITILRALYREVQVPDEIFNAVLNKFETV